MRDVFHLAIAARNVAETKAFYDELGCEIARVYSDRVTMNFFDRAQAVCHLAPDNIRHRPALYPNHFGVRFRNRATYEALHTRVSDRGMTFFLEEAGRFAVADPSNNVVVFGCDDDATGDIFHLALASRDVVKTKEFYQKLGCRIGDGSDDQVMINFFDIAEVLCRKAPDKIDPEPTFYPNHFGVLFTDRARYDEIYKHVCEHNLTLFQEDTRRFEGREDAHNYFAAVDSAANWVIEFKCYDQGLVY